MDVIATSNEEALRPLRTYLAAHGVDPALASGPVGLRYLALRSRGHARTPAEAFDRWFAEYVGGAPGEAEGLGWIAFFLAAASPENLLGELPPATAQALAARAPRPQREAPLAMPVQELARIRRRAAAAGRALLAPRTPA